METGDVEYSNIQQGRPTTIVNETLELAIEYYLKRKPSMHLDEIQKKLQEDNICQPHNLPSVDYIGKIIRNRLGFSRKKLTVKAKEAFTAAAQEKFDRFLDNIEGKNPMKFHWFDESSVVMTTGNRRYGYAAVGERAFEIQKYASNANFTINLLQSPFGIDYYNVIDGPSNGLRLIDFFVDALNAQDIYGNRKLTHGDVVIMDNCGFHHGNLAETYLRNLLRQNGVTLVYQPPYCPELNTCERSFSKLKHYLRRNSSYTETFPTLAVCDGISEISSSDCFHYAKHCGYF